MPQSIDVHLYMEKGMYGRLVERARELGVPLSAVVRDAVVQYFAHIPEVADREAFVPQPDDSLWEIPDLHRSFGALSVPRTENGGAG